MSGHEVGGLALSPVALDALGMARTSGNPCEYVVTGEEWHSDGRHFLTFGVPAAFIESVTDYRHEDHAAAAPEMTRGSLHYLCPECGLRRGKHVRGCARQTA